MVNRAISWGGRISKITRWDHFSWILLIRNKCVLYGDSGPFVTQTFGVLLELEEVVEISLFLLEFLEVVHACQALSNFKFGMRKLKTR